SSSSSKKKMISDANRQFEEIDNLILEFIRLPLDLESGNALKKRRLSSSDWQLFIQRAFEEGVSGLIYYNLSNAGFKFLLPQWVHEKFKQDYIHNLGRNIFINTQLRDIFLGFKKKQIPLLLLRGIDFLNRVYPSAGIRAMSDVDLLIHSEHQAGVKELLSGLGYDYTPGYAFFFYKDNLFIDLHLDVIGFWRIKTCPFAINIKNSRVWEQAESLSDLSPDIRVLSLYDSILACCLHLQTHSFGRLMWFVDVAVLIRNAGDSFDWQVLLERAREFNFQRPVYFVMRYLNAARILSVPPEALSCLGNFAMNRLERRTLHMLLDNQRSGIFGELLYIFSIPKLKNRLRFVWDTIFMEREKVPLARKRLTPWSSFRRILKIVLYVAGNILVIFIMKPRIDTKKTKKYV
ncbi:MAG: nucleotidyltransferase family protein, partial [Candidatus Omnitrophota bacterium]